MRRAYLPATMRAFDQPAYLGLDRHPEWLALVGEGMALYGVHYAGSRGASYCPAVYADVERVLAAWLGAPAVTLVSSGSLLAVMMVDQLLAEGYAVLAGPLAHACWRRAGVVAFEDAEAWRRRALELARRGARVAIVSDRVCAVRCRKAKLDWLRGLPSGAVVVLDDSHAIGVLGPRGGGSWVEFGGLPAELIVCASLGKSFSVPGAVMVSSRARAQRLRSTAAFGGASSVPPGYAHALATGLDLALAQRTRLSANEAALAEAGLAHVADHPAFSLTESQAGQLAAAGVAFARTRYPTAESAEVSRLVVSAGHSTEEVAQVATLLRGCSLAEAAEEGSV